MYQGIVVIPADLFLPNMRRGKAVREWAPNESNSSQ